MPAREDFSHKKRCGKTSSMFTREYPRKKSEARNLSKAQDNKTVWGTDAEVAEMKKA